MLNLSHMTDSKVLEPQSKKKKKKNLKNQNPEAQQADTIGAKEMRRLWRKSLTENICLQFVSER